ncbi:peptidylprolyl isomerase [Rhodohalobacter sp. SW132]|uniref:peptidylprolyl isomerase n=1 Tax=Rhodohalobacter sp. SW132 TaxID=2293433 RepID=UPI0018F7729C|nr:peptidylprolyl isomerase [Rhodohalobacter sp. SW132]
MNILHSSLGIVSFSIILLLLTNCSGQPEPIYTNPVIVDVYPGLAEAVVSRDFDQLHGYLSHEDENVRAAAWHAIGKSETDQTERLLTAVIRENSIAAWQALSFYEIDAEGVEQVDELLQREDNTYIKACEFYRRQGDADHIPMLLQKKDPSEHAHRCAAAIGAIVSRVEINDEMKRDILNRAFESENPEYRRNLLYGFYRSGLNRPEPESELRQAILDDWLETVFGSEKETDRYMVRILGEKAAENLLELHGGIRRVNDIPLAVEIARNIPLTGDEHSDVDRIKSFLSHSNPHVIAQTLETLKQHAFSSDELNDFIYSEITVPTRNPEVFITSLEYLQQQNINLSGLAEKQLFAEKAGPYLTHRYLEFYRTEKSPDEYLRKIEEHIKAGEIRSLHATQSLSQFWTENDADAHRAEIHRLVRIAVESQSRSAISGLNTLLNDEVIIEETDFEWLDGVYTDAVENGYDEFAEQLGQNLESRFPDRYTQRHDAFQKEFRMPDWDRLHALGTRPHWRLETSRGVVEVRLDPLTAPFTVSSIDSLTRAGAYEGAAFHRVVRNFVVQGGDFDRRDGFGGPDYRIPTEPSTRSFERGSVGIASSGTDTEGGQFYFMHIWAPHLDGSYTRFGEVVRGMDVVDKLRIGDRVERASISVR